MLSERSGYYHLSYLFYLDAVVVFARRPLHVRMILSLFHVTKIGGFLKLREESLFLDLFPHDGSQHLLSPQLLLVQWLKRAGVAGSSAPPSFVLALQTSSVFLAASALSLPFQPFSLSPSLSTPSPSFRPGWSLWLVPPSPHLHLSSVLTVGPACHCGRSRLSTPLPFPTSPHRTLTL